jgi:hypothetical protein
LNVFKVEIGLADSSLTSTGNRTIHVLASSIADAVEKGEEYLKDDYASCPEDAENYAVVSATRVLMIDWPHDPQE